MLLMNLSNASHAGHYGIACGIVHVSSLLLQCRDGTNIAIQRLLCSRPAILHGQPLGAQPSFSKQSLKSVAQIPMKKEAVLIDSAISRVT